MFRGNVAIFNIAEIPDSLISTGLPFSTPQALESIVMSTCSLNLGCRHFHGPFHFSRWLGRMMCKLRFARVEDYA
jgi:hypothetical protein